MSMTREDEVEAEILQGMEDDGAGFKSRSGRVRSAAGGGSKLNRQMTAPYAPTLPAPSPLGFGPPEPQTGRMAAWAPSSMAPPPASSVFGDDDDDNRTVYSNSSRISGRTALRNPYNTDDEKMVQDLKNVPIYTYKFKNLPEAELAKAKREGLERLTREVTSDTSRDFRAELYIRKEMVTEKVNKDLKSVRRTKAVMQTRDTFVLPAGYSTVEKKEVSVRRFQTISDLMAMKRGDIVTFDNPQNVFGSTTAYMQSTFLPVSDRPNGDVKNVYLGEITMARVVNEFPFDIGLILRERRRGQTNIDESDKIYNNRTKVGNDGNRYHYILPAHCRLGDVPSGEGVFRNDHSITNEISLLFPNITDDYVTFFNSKDVKLAPSGDAYFFEPSNPIVQMAYRLSGIMEGMEGPKLHKEGSRKFVWLRKAEAAHFAEMIHRALLASCIVNFETFYIQCVPVIKLDIEKNLALGFHSHSRRLLTQSRTAGDAETREVRKVKFDEKNLATVGETVETVYAPATGIAVVDSTGSHRKLWENTRTFGFTLQMTYFFREMAPVPASIVQQKMAALPQSSSSNGLGVVGGVLPVISEFATGNGNVQEGEGEEEEDYDQFDEGSGSDVDADESGHY